MWQEYVCVCVCTNLIQWVAEELCSSYFNVEEQKIHVDSLPARNLTDQALLWNTKKTHTHNQSLEMFFMCLRYVVLCKKLAAQS